MREGVALGAISPRRTEARLFTERQVALLKTFADQAVIAIENVRLFTELQQRTGELTRSVEKLTALGEVSQTVSSTLDLQTVLDTITDRARQLAGADGGAIHEYDEGRATETREPIQIADIAAPGVYESHLRDVLIGAGYRALLSVPIVREGQIIGSLSLNRQAPGEFSALASLGPSPRSRPWQSRTRGSSARSPTRVDSSRSPASTSPSSSPTCRTSWGRRSTPSSDSPRS